MEGGTLQLLHDEDELDGRELYLHDYPSVDDDSTIVLMHLPTWKIHVEYPQGKSFTLQISNPEVMSEYISIIVINCIREASASGNL